MIRRGEIYWVTFSGARGSEQAGTRPALIIQNDRGNEFSNKTIVAALTSRVDVIYPFRVEVAPQDSGLSRRSAVMLDQILTVSEHRLGRRIGRLSVDDMVRVDRALHYSLGLTD